MSTKLKLSLAMLNEAKNSKELISLDAVEENWINTYNKTTGRPDGKLRYETEKVLFMSVLSGSPKLEACTKISQYSAWMELAISGLTLRDGLTYIVPYKDKAVFMIGWKGRLEQIKELPSVIHCHEPQVVYDCDEFIIEHGMNTIIKKHVKTLPRPANALPIHVYFVIDFKYGSKVYDMTVADVFKIRDNYSSSYKKYIKDLSLPINKGRKEGDKLLVTYKEKGTNESKTFESDEVPMWISDKDQAIKKTLVKRTYTMMDKLPRHKILDEQLKQKKDIDDIDEVATALTKETQGGEPVLTQQDIDDLKDNTYLDYTETDIDPSEPF